MYQPAHPYRSVLYWFFANQAAVLNKSYSIVQIKQSWDIRTHPLSHGVRIILFSCRHVYKVCIISSCMCVFICPSQGISFLPFTAIRYHSIILKGYNSLACHYTCLIAITKGLVLILRFSSFSIMSIFMQYACCLMFFLNAFSVNWTLIRLDTASCISSHWLATSLLMFSGGASDFLRCDRDLLNWLFVIFLYAS